MSGWFWGLHWLAECALAQLIACREIFAINAYSRVRSVIRVIAFRGDLESNLFPAEKLQWEIEQSYGLIVRSPWRVIHNYGGTYVLSPSQINSSTSVYLRY